MAKKSGGNPPLNALKAFDAVARLGSMNKAAHALGIAPSSVTQHIRNLEDYVGGDLFDRSANAITLNGRGRAYAKKILTAFDTIQEATSAISLEISLEPIRISCVPTLAGPWLAEQLAAIQKQFPGIELRCDFSPALADFDGNETDIAIRYGAGVYSGTHAELLYTDTMAPVCTPHTAQQISRVGDMNDLIRLDSVESAPNGVSLWAYWEAQAEGKDVTNRFGAKPPWALQSSRFSMEVLRATPSVAILERSVVQQHLTSGVLVAPFDMWVSAPFGYYIVTSKRRALQPAAKHLKSLLKHAAVRHFLGAQ